MANSEENIVVGTDDSAEEEELIFNPYNLNVEVTRHDIETILKSMGFLHVLLILNFGVVLLFIVLILNAPKPKMKQMKLKLHHNHQTASLFLQNQMNVLNS